MKEVDLIALAGFLHDIGKFGQRAEIDLREPFKSSNYGYMHSNYTAQILQYYFNDIENYHQAAYEHHIVNKNSDINSWIVAVADRLASGFEREEFEEYNQQVENEIKTDFKKQRLISIFNKDRKYKIAEFSVENIFYAENEAKENEYKTLWNSFEKDLEKLSKSEGNQKTDFFSIDYLLKRYTTFIPSSTTFGSKYSNPIKANIPLYDHLKATAIFASAIYELDDDIKENLINYYRKTKSYRETNEFLLINGDFFGIQNFIFNDVEAKAAAKILRGKSAYVQLLTKIIAFYIVEKLGLSFYNIINDSAGKFEILAPNKEEIKSKLLEIKKELNQFFVKEFFGETGIGVSFVECGLFDFIEKGKYKKLREKLAEAVEIEKFRKFGLVNNHYEIEWEDNLNNQNQCFACKKRVGKERKNIEKKVCNSCFRFIEIGKNLANKKYLVITKDKTSIPIFGDYYIKFVDEPKGIRNVVVIYDISKDIKFNGFAKWEISSYVAIEENGEILTFEELAKRSCKECEKDGEKVGIEAIMSLKADVDNMGLFIRDEKNGITNSFATFNFFSRMIDYYFSVYVPYLMREKYPNTYTIFAGGDDLFLIGAWDEIIELAKEVRKDFIKFVEGSPLTLSAGFILTKPNKPINFIARLSEEALEHSKENEGKDSITIFNETMKWNDYLNDDGLVEIIDLFNDNTTMLYRLLQFCDMSKNISKNLENVMWKSKLRYIFARDVEIEKSFWNKALKTFDFMIDKYPDVTRAYLSEYIYKRRKK